MISEQNNDSLAKEMTSALEKANTKEEIETAVKKCQIDVVTVHQRCLNTLFEKNEYRKAFFLVTTLLADKTSKLTVNNASAFLYQLEQAAIENKNMPALQAAMLIRYYVGTDVMLNMDCRLHLNKLLDAHLKDKPLMNYLNLPEDHVKNMAFLLDDLCCKVVSVSGKKEILGYLQENVRNDNDFDRFFEHDNIDNPTPSNSIVRQSTFNSVNEMSSKSMASKPEEDGFTLEKRRWAKLVSERKKFSTMDNSDQIEELLSVQPTSLNLGSNLNDC